MKYYYYYYFKSETRNRIRKQRDVTFVYFRCQQTTTQPNDFVHRKVEGKFGCDMEIHGFGNYDINEKNIICFIFIFIFLKLSFKSPRVF